MDRAGDEFFARPALTSYQHCAFIGADRANDAIERAHRGALANQRTKLFVRPNLTPQVCDLFTQPFGFQQFVYLEQQLVRVTRFGEVISCATLHGLDRTLDRAMTSENDDRAA